MERYTYAEIGMLLGAAIGCLIAFISFYTGGNWFIIAVIGFLIVLGTLVGRGFDRKQYKKENGKAIFK